jgi:hypothetical protein
MTIVRDFNGGLAVSRNRAGTRRRMARFARAGSHRAATLRAMAADPAVGADEEFFDFPKIHNFVELF